MNPQVADAFKRLYFGKRTGILTCEARAARRAVFFRSGFVVAAKSSLEDDRLGEVMIRHGRITKQHFVDASHFIKSGWKLGRILAELKVIEEAEIETFVRIQLLDIACMQLISPPRRLAFSRLSNVDSLVEAPLSVADILMEAARRTPDVDECVETLKSDERRLGFPEDPLKRFQEVNLKPEEAFVLSRIDGTQSSKDIFAMSPLPDEQTARTLLGLVQAEIIEPEGEPPEPEVEETREPTEKKESLATADREPQIREVEQLFKEIEKKDHWQVLGLPRDADANTILQAFFEGARRYHPDRFRHITDPTFHEKLSHVFMRIRDAYKTLSSREKSHPYQKLADKESQYDKERQEWKAPPSAKATAPPASRDPSEAKSVFSKARSAYKDDDYWNCIELCQQAIELVSDKGEYYHLLGLALSKNPKWRQDAEKNLKIASNLDLWKAEYLVDLGKLYLDAGLHLRARKVLEQAKAVNPGIEIPELD